ncbi:MAG: hypothetical protein IPM18_09030 [Phycisphaerales bacterium]|nr:hypothetical protein [Phycisphaerales bacterium]
MMIAVQLQAEIRKRSLLIGTGVVVLMAYASMAGAASSEGKIFVPIPLADKVRATEATQADIGAAEAVFDGQRDTVLRTPAINPAFVRVEFTEPITFEHIRLHLIDTRHTWSLAAADSLEDLKAQSGSFRWLKQDVVSRGAQVEVPFEEPQTIRALQFDVRRQGGDDFVHVYEIELCRPGAVERLMIERISSRRQAISPATARPVEELIEVPVQTVVALGARAAAGDAVLEVGNEVRWESRSPGVELWLDKPGEFLVTAEGQHEVVAKYGDFTETIQVVGTPRRVRNREADVEIWYIERLPRIDYDGPNAGLPVEGQEVTWRGHLYNWGRGAVRVEYEWKLNETILKTGTVELPPGPPSNETVTVDLPWRWQGVRHDLTLTLTPPRNYRDLVPANNTLTIQTDAITVGFWVEQSLWDHHHEYQHWLPTHDANSFAGWSQRMMRQWNQMFAEAKYPELPNGVTERVRLDRLVIVPDFALPLSGGLPSNNPDRSDKTVDMTWGHEAGDLRPGFEVPEDHWWSPVRALRAFARGSIAAQQEDPPFWCGLGYIHELAHARYLVDSYGFNVHTGTERDPAQRINFPLKDEHGYVLGRYMPLDQDIQRWRKYPGQMGGNYWVWSVFEGMCWERVRGQRARGGNCNSPPTIGEFLQDIPSEVVLRYVDSAGRPLADAEVWVYRARGSGKDWYTKVFVDAPDLQKRTDADGRVSFDRTLWAEDGRIRHGFGHSSAVACVRITHAGQHYYTFEEVTDANLAYYLGHRERYEFLRQIRLRTGAPDPGEWDVNDRWEPEGIGFGRR